MKLSVSDLVMLFRPSRCDRRVYLAGKGIPSEPPGPFEQVIKRLGIEHEKRYLAALPSAVDLGSGTHQERAAQTQREITRGTAVIYHGLFVVDTTIGGTPCEVVGEPDFLIADHDGHIIRDAKIARRITKDDHPEILLQMGLYGWLFEKAVGRAPAGLSVLGGTGEVTELRYDGGAAAVDALTRVVAILKATAGFYEPVGWSKCVGCGFHSACWSKAETERDVALVAGVDQGLARALRQEGVTSYDGLIRQFSERSLAELRRPWGTGTQKVGRKAAVILLMAKAMATGTEIPLEPAAIPDHDNFVMFDLEGLPPHLDELGKIYLWGMQVFGKQPGSYMAATSGFGANGDREGWNSFLAKAETIFSRYGDIPFVHWAPYEKTHLDEYVQRFGDRDGIAARVRKNLLDLLPITREAVALPLPSYSLKVVEGYVGFKRTQDEYGGAWSMAKYIEATELQDEAQRGAVMDQILTYNREDLEATWAVFEWLRAK